MPITPRPLVIAHRGQSSELPENTHEAFRLAFTRGANAIETDVVPTLDGHLVLRHENSLDATTNIADLPAFSSYQRDSTNYQGTPIRGWFSEDLTLAQVQQLRARERVPHLRPDSAAHDDQYAIPTLAELLTADYATANHTLIIELKNAAMFTDRGYDLIDLIDRTINELTKPVEAPLVFQTFTFDVAIEMKRRLPEHRSLYIVGPTHGPAVTPAWIESLAGRLDGLALESTHLRTPGVRDALANNDLLAFTWTSEFETSENIARPDWFTDRIAQHPDGMFTDHAQVLAQVISAVDK